MKGGIDFEKPNFLQREIHGGIQKKWKFPNGYGASVVKHSYSYGGEKGLWELAVIEFDGEKEIGLCYTTPITSDVIGHLTPNEVIDLLKRIEELKAKEDESKT